MRTRGIVAFAACLPCLSAAAGDFELALHGGPAFPFYEQSLTYDPGPLAPSIPGLSLDQSGSLRFEGKGGIAAGVGLSWHPLRVLGLEARYDSAAVDIRSLGARYRVRVNLPAPLPPLSTDLDVGTGAADVDRVQVASLNLRLRTPTALRLSASGGLSYLPRLRARVTQRVGVGITGVDGRLSRVDLARVGLRAEAAADEPGRAWGANAGAGIEIGGRVSFRAEGRFFVFPKRTLRWSRDEGLVLTPIEEALLQEVLSRLSPLEFSPTLFQATAGVVVRFW